MKTVPSSASARPRLPRMTYFHAPFERRPAGCTSATSSTDERAVASTAAHISRGCSPVTARNMPQPNSGVSMKNSFTCHSVTTRATRSRWKYRPA